jgi:hypothetical protein
LHSVVNGRLNLHLDSPVVRRGCSKFRLQMLSNQLIATLTRVTPAIFVPSEPFCTLAEKFYTVCDIETMSALVPENELTDFDPEIERRVRRRLDYTILPILCFFMFVSFLDRGNIGNAKIQGMTKDLHMRGNDYNIAVMLFTVAYIIFGLPASLIFKKTGPQSLSVMMLLWGIAIKFREASSGAG